MIDFEVGFVVFDVMLDSNQKHVNLIFTREGIKCQLFNVCCFEISTNSVVF